MRKKEIALKVCCAVMLTAALMLTFTVSDYYIFNRIGFGSGCFNPFFVLSQWFKKAGYLLIPMAVFYKRKSCSDIARYFLPVFVIVSFCSFGKFFDITMMTDGASPADKVYASINEFMPKAANITLFFIAGVAELACCALLFWRDGFKVDKRSFIYLPFAVVATMPLNIFENFFDITRFSRDGFWWFRNFTVWHFLALAVLAGSTIGGYYFLRKKDPETQNAYLAAIAVVLLIQYHSKDSMVMGDGYNVYHTVFACIPLFICNIGVYVACLSVFLKKRTLYSMAFFVHAAGALSVFVYFGRDDMSNYGIPLSYSILYFCLTHCLLFALSVLPSALGKYKFRLKDCLIPMAYYCVVIIIAAVSSGLVTSASMSFSYDGYTLAAEEWLYPNYAFTQINPIPIPAPNLPITLWRCELNLLYLIILYAVYVGLFWIFTGSYYAFLAVRKRVLAGTGKSTVPATAPAAADAGLAEVAATEEHIEPESAE